MSLSTYSDLVAAIGNWLNRSDLSARIPEFIALAEAEFNRRIRTMDMEQRAYATVSNAIALPSDFNGMAAIKVDETSVAFLPKNDFFRLELTGPAAPKFYTIADGQIFLTPTPTSGNVTIDYYAKIPALTVSNPTNWMMTEHPDLYLFSSLVQAEFYGWNDDRLPLIKARCEEIIDQIEAQEDKKSYGSAPLAPRLQAGAWLNT